METIQAGIEVLPSNELGARGTILAATDGTTQSDGALAAAASLAAATGSTVHIVTVQPPLAPIVPDGPVLLEPDVTIALTAARKERARAQSAAIAAENPGARFPEPEVLAGDPERVITQAARDKGAQLIIVGIGRHDVMDRIFGSETAVKVARLSRVPVLAVPAAFRGAFRQAVVGLDLSDASQHAAQAAVPIVASGGIIHLVHVAPRERLLIDPWMSDREYDDIVQQRISRVRARLAVPPNVSVEHATATGDAARALIEYAAKVDADVIVAGSHGHGFVSRLLLGSVTTALLRAATTAVLVVPPDAASASGHGGGTTSHIEPSQWPAMLADFSRMNAGRHTRLEIDEPDIGAQGQETDYPLRGVAFDPHDQRLEIMLGALGAGEPHLSRSIGDVRSLDLLTDKNGVDLALRARHGDGQTVLTFLSS